MLFKSSVSIIPWCVSLTILCSMSIVADAKSTLTGDLPRRADLGFSFSRDQQIKVTHVDKSSIAASSGLQAGDIILAINGTPFADPLTAATRLNKIKGSEKLTLRVERKGKPLALAFIPSAKQLEAIPGIDSEYGVVSISDKVKLRSIVSYSSDAQVARPAIFFVQWVSCGSLEYRPTSVSSQVFAELVKKAERTLIRVERSTSGDSIGPACHELDYNTELEHYYQAFLQLARHPKVDARDIILYGSSLGATIAPLLAKKLLAKGHNVSGIMINGGGALTYFERMLHFERIYLERKMDPQGRFLKPETLQSELIQRSLFFTEYLIHGRHPDSIAKDSKMMAKVRQNIRGLNSHDHYGRPFQWHQQAAQHNFLSAWPQLNIPVLVVYNEFDQFETRHGHKMIVDMINRWRPGTATYVEQKNMGHSNYYYASAENAYNNLDGRSSPERLSQHLVSWLKQQK